MQDTPPTTQAPLAYESKATAALTLGIISIVFGGVFFVSLPCGIIGYRYAAKELRLIANGTIPRDGYGLATAGKVCSIVGICIGSLMTAFMLLTL